MEIITSRDNLRFKRAKSLLLKKNRDKQQLCLIEGVRLITHIMDRHPQWIDSIFINPFTSADLQGQFSSGVILEESLFHELSDTVHSQGIIACVRTHEIDQTLGSDLILALDDIQDPGNMGTIIRTCDAVGSVDLLLSKGCVDIFNPKVLRSAMGSLFDVKINRLSSFVLELKAYKKQGYHIVGAALQSASSLNGFCWPDKTILVIGNEGNGISDEILELCDMKVIIPLKGEAESLNASVAAGILLYDAIRNIHP